MNRLLSKQTNFFINVRLRKYYTVTFKLIVGLIWFLAQLHSKEEVTRDEAIQGTKNLAKQCSDPGAVEKVLKHYSAVLNGK